MVENIINNKKYIGQSLREDIKTRWKYHKTPDSKRYIGQILYDAYKKHGIENFKFIIICICFDQDADKYEKEYICKYNTLYPNGYNLQSGGENKKHSVYTKQMMSEKMSGENHPNYGKTPSSETILKIKRSNMEHYKNKLKNSSNNDKTGKGRRQTDETREKIRQVTINNVMKNSKIRIHQYDLNMNLLNTFVSYGQASKQCNVSRNSIMKSCISKRSSRDFFWIREDI